MSFGNRMGGKKNSQQILIKHRKRTDPWRKEGGNGTARFRRNASEAPSPPSAVPAARAPSAVPGRSGAAGAAPGEARPLRGLGKRP